MKAPLALRSSSRHDASTSDLWDDTIAGQLEPKLRDVTAAKPCPPNQVRRVRPPISIEPLQQGELDGLCGVYAIINAVRLLVGPRRANDLEIWGELFQELCTELDLTVGAGTAVCFGVPTKDMLRAIKHAARWLADELDVSVIVTQSLLGTGRPCIEVVLREIRDHLTQPRASVVAGIGGPLDHWTVIAGITARTLRLFDSGGHHALRVAGCRMAYEPVLRPSRKHVLALGSLVFVARVS